MFYVYGKPYKTHSTWTRGKTTNSNNNNGRGESDVGRMGNERWVKVVVLVGLCCLLHVSISVYSNIEQQEGEEGHLSRVKLWQGLQRGKMVKVK